MMIRLTFFLIFPSLVLAQKSVSFSQIDSLIVPPADSALAHAYLYSPLLYKDQMRSVKSEHLVSKWGFAASLVPSPSYSFSSLDRGWRLSLSVGSLISALKEYRVSRDKIRDNALCLEQSRESLCYALLSSYSNFEKCLIELEDLESALVTEKEKVKFDSAKFRGGFLSDAEMNKAVSDLKRSEDKISIKRLEVRGICIDIYRISGFRIESPVVLTIWGP